MSSTGSVAHTAVGNGTNANGRQHTPAEMVGNQFVQQFYSVLHSSPRYLYRFYTDESTVTHADCGIDGDSPTSVTVTSQKGISDRVASMGFEEAVTEIWSVDSQYSQNNGVMVMVTGSLQCKGKKKRDFVQSFFLAPQEKGYFVLNDTLRYLSERRPGQYPKENGYIHSNYDKSYNQMAGYHQNSYYNPTQMPAHPSHHPSTPMYSTHTPASYPSAVPVPSAAQQSISQKPGSDATRGHAVTPSMPVPRSVQPVVPKSAAEQSPAVVPVQPPPAPTNPPMAASIVPQPVSASQIAPAPPAAPQPAPAAPAVTAAPEPVPEAPQQPAAPALTSPAEASVDSSASAAPPPALSKSAAKEEDSETKPPPASKPAEPPAEKETKPAPPAAPLTYADRLKLGAQRAPAGKPAAAKPTSAPPKTTAPVPPKAPEPVDDSARAFEAPEPSNSTVNGNIGVFPEENLASSIFVRDLPEGITSEKMEEAFSRFGPVKNGVQGVNLKQQKGKEDFAFVEFEEAAAMQAAIEGQVIIDGKTVTVMERRPQFPRNLKGPGYQRNNERSGRGSGEGRGFRGDRGRGDRGRGGGRSEGRPFTGGRGENRSNENRGEGRGGPEGGGRGRSFSGGFPEGGRGRGEPRRGRGDGHGGRGSSSRGPPLQSAPPARAQQA